MPVTRGEPRGVRPPPKPRTPRVVPTRLPGDPRVAAVQSRLRKAGINVAVDGVYGPQTDAAIKRYNTGLAQQNAASRRGAANIIKTQYTAPHPTLPRPNLDPGLHGPARLAHAITRMHKEGWNDNAIRVQVKNWNPGWSEARVKNAIDAARPVRTSYPPGSAAAAQAQLGGHPSYDVAPATTEDLRRAHIAARAPIVQMLGGMTNPIEQAKWLIGTGAGVGTAIQAGRKLTQQPSLGAAGSFGLAAGIVGANFLPFGEGISRGLAGARAAIDTAGTGAGLAETVRATRSTYATARLIPSKRDQTLLDSIQSELDASPERTAVQQEISRQVRNPRKAARLKMELDVASARLASNTAKESGQDIAAHANELYSRLHGQGRSNPFVFDTATVSANQARRARVNRLKELPRANRRTLDPNGIPLTGRTTVGDVIKRIRLATPSAEQRAADAAFYHDVRNVLSPVYSDPEIMGWLASQRAASPARGITDLMRVLDAARAGRDVPATGPGSIGVAAQTIEQLVRGDSGLSTGARAKISDFVDAALHKTTRTWMGDHPDFGAPGVVDRWGYRSWGYVDGDWQKLNPHLKADKINDNHYEFISRKYQDLAKELNRRGFDGRRDWSVEEAQAMDWAAIQRYHGVHPEGMQYAFDVNARTLQTQAPPEEIAATLERHNVRQVAEPVTDQHGRTSIRVIGSPEGYRSLAQDLADRHGQVWMMRDVGSKANKPMLAISGENVAAHVQAAKEAGFTHVRELPDGSVEVFAPDGGIKQAKVGELTKSIGDAGGNVSSNKVELDVVHGRARSHPDLSAADANRGLAGTAGGPGRDLHGTRVSASEYLSARAGNARAWNLSEHDLNELGYHVAIVSPDGKAGYMVSPDGNLQGVFNNPGGVKGQGARLVSEAVEQRGAKTLDAYDPFLPSYYGRVGFAEVARLKFDPAFAPDGMPAEIQAQKPDIVFMALDATERPGNYVDSWQQGEEAANAVAQGRSDFQPNTLPLENVPGLDIPHPADAALNEFGNPASVRFATGPLPGESFPEQTLATTHEPVSALTPEEQLKQGLRSARSQYGKQKVTRSEERKRRAEEVAKALQSIADPEEARAAAADAMRGELPQIDFQGLTTLNDVSLKHLKTFVKNHETLLPFQKIRLMDSLDRAVKEHRVPPPAEMRLIEHVFGKKTAIGIAQSAGSWGDTIINILNIPRSLMATLDLSAAARQGLVAGTSHPVIWGRSIPTMVKSMRSSRFYEETMQEIESDPSYPLALAARVSFTDVGEHATLVAREEQFASDYAARIPGVGHAIKGSSRAYTGFLNKVRMDLFKNQIRIALAAGTDVHDEKFLSDIGDVVNAATGRGTIHGRAEHFMPALNTMLFSPRLMLSRLNYLDPTWYVRLSPQARREALRGLFATSAAVTSALYMFSRIPGVNVGSLDPRSADFGKLKIGNTRIDVAGGFQQYIRLAAELATGATVSSTTGKKTELGSGYGKPTRLDLIIKFGEGKLAPFGAIVTNALRGKDPVGNPVTPESIVTSNFTPLILQDAHDIYKENHGGLNGIEWAMAGYALGAFGLGIQTYAPKPVKGKPHHGSGADPVPGFGSTGASDVPGFGSSPRVQVPGLP